MARPYPKRATIPPEKRFWSKVSFGFGPDACWTWKGGMTATGYGLFMVAKSSPLIYAHRYVMRLLGVESEATHHRCGNHGCVNPAHLEAMTDSEHKRHHASLKPRDALGNFVG